jgi:subtilisin-like proprotein convertase family protein
MHARARVVRTVLSASSLFLFAVPPPAAAQTEEERDAARSAAAAADLAPLAPSAVRQIQAIVNEKLSRTPTERKISSTLLSMAKTRKRRASSAPAEGLKPLVAERPDGRVDVEILGPTTKRVVERLEKAGGQVLYGHVKGESLRALVPVEAIELIAALAEVRGIRPTLFAVTERLRSDLGRGIDRIVLRKRGSGAVTDAPDGTIVSEGDRAHRADTARHFFGLTGAGVTIGVLSDSNDFLEDSIARGELPADVTTLPGQDGRPGSGEGTAMLEIVHDLAPGAKLFFATAFAGSTSFADNIRALRAAGCDIIVDDVIYFSESPFQDGEIAKAVDDVVKDGALYFSSAGNGGNADDGTSGVWEGDFKKAKSGIGALAGLGDVHDFGQGVVSDRTEGFGGPVVLYWSDRAGRSANDYDLFILDNALTTVLAASTDVQDGDDDPVEFLGFLVDPGLRIVILKFSGADRALHLVDFGGEFGLATFGAIQGHAAVKSAFGVAAVDAALAGSGSFTGGASNPVELFSSDGNRRVFYDFAGHAYKSGKYLFKNGGGERRRKPDVSAADGVSTSVPGFFPFFGTSAAAPHAAAIAGLVKSARPTFTRSRIRSVLTSTALDIEAEGRDRDSGFGLLDAFDALTAADAQPAPFLELGTVSASELQGDGDGTVEPGESAQLTVELENTGGAAPQDLNGVLSTTTPGVTLLSSSSPWPSIAPGTSAPNTVPFAFSLDPSLVCGRAADFELTASYSNGQASPQTFTFRVVTGEPGTVPTSFPYTGPVVPVPDATPAGVDVPLTVSGLAAAVSRVVFSIDGTACTADEEATTVGLDHTWVGDLVITLTSPSGTRVVLANRPGGQLNSGNNFCQTVLEDGAPDSIQTITPDGAPYTGTFAPASPLSAFVGEEGNGTWTLNVSDQAQVDVGNVRAFSLRLETFTCN